MAPGTRIVSISVESRLQRVREFIQSSDSNLGTGVRVLAWACKAGSKGAFPYPDQSSTLRNTCALRNNTWRRSIQVVIESI